MVKKYLDKYTMITNKKVPTNYRVVLYIGRDLKTAHVSDGKGMAKNLNDAIKMFDSVRDRKTCLKAELYFEDQLIKKV